jgi:hypothetical protein
MYYHVNSQYAQAAKIWRPTSIRAKNMRRPGSYVKG